MSEYREIKRVGALAPREFSEEDHKRFFAGNGNKVVSGMSGNGEPGQLDIWHVDGRTFIVPVNGSHSVLPFSLTGTISPHDCRAFVRAKLL